MELLLSFIAFLFFVGCIYSLLTSLNRIANALETIAKNSKTHS